MRRSRRRDRRGEGFSWDLRSGFGMGRVSRGGVPGDRADGLGVAGQQGIAGGRQEPAIEKAKDDVGVEAGAIRSAPGLAEFGSVEIGGAAAFDVLEKPPLVGRQTVDGGSRAPGHGGDRLEDDGAKTLDFGSSIGAARTGYFRYVALKRAIGKSPAIAR